MSLQRAAKPTEVFVSHASANARFVNRLVKTFSLHGVRSFYSRKHIAGSQAWHDEIGMALDRCDCFVLVLTPHAVESKWVKYELVYALQEDRYEGRIIPVLLRDCDSRKLSWTLSSTQYIDFRRNFHRGSTALLRLWGLPYDVQT